MLKPFSLLLFIIYIGLPGLAQSRYHAPITIEQAGKDKLPARYVEPTPTPLPSDETLTTTHVKNHTYHITRRNPALSAKAFDYHPSGLTHYSKDNEALTFFGTQASGRLSKERLIIEDCTFIIDFQKGDFKKWDALRSAVYVEGYKEVIIRRCKFISKTKSTDPVRKSMASIALYDVLRVHIEDCYFEGHHVWFRGHITVYCCGEVTIRNVEIAGVKEANGHYACGGGIWIANGLGEGKIGTLHANNPYKQIYPAGPALIENVYIHDQTGKENTDAIYLQAVHQFAIRNSKIENWTEDGLIDIGWRDTLGKKHQGKPLANHGAMGLIENCEFRNGHLKASVGLGGGVILRNSRLENVYIFPYVFDGGNWYFLQNEINNMETMVLTGANDQHRGWQPKEGLALRGSQYIFYDNDITVKAGKKGPKAVFWGGKPGTAALTDVVLSDYNRYTVDESLRFAVDNTTKLTWSQWQAAGLDKHSTYNSDEPKASPDHDLNLPGGFSLNPAPTKKGLTGPVGSRHTKP